MSKIFWIRIVFVLCLIIPLSLFCQRTTAVRYAVYGAWISGPGGGRNNAETYYEYLLYNKMESFYFDSRMDDLEGKDWSIVERVKNFHLKDGSTKILDFNNGVYYQIVHMPHVKELSLAIDRAPVIVWKIDKKDTKEILGYHTISAEADFRGRHYKVYFAPDISTSEGPWKLKGLPGLILEAQDESGTYIYKADRLFLNSPITIPSVVIQFYKDKIHQVIPYKTYVQARDEMMLAISRKMLASQSDGSIPQQQEKVDRSYNREESFEWQLDTSSLNKDREKQGSDP